MGIQLIERVDVGSGGLSQIVFTSIPQDGVDLLCLYSLRARQGAGNQVFIRPNGVSTGLVSMLKLADGQFTGIG